MTASTETVTFTVNKEHSVADTSSGSDVGSAGDDHAPIGDYGGWTWRELLRASLSFGSEPPGGWKFLDAELWMKTTSDIHVNTGSSPRIRGCRLSGAFTASGGSENSWGTTYGTSWPGPSASGTLYDLGVLSGYAENKVFKFDISDMFEPWIPTSMLTRAGAAGAAETNHGMRVQSFLEGDGTRTCEFYSMRGSYAPRFVVRYREGFLPGMPALTGPSGVQASAPTSFVGVATESPVSKYDVQVSTDPAFGSFLWNAAGLTSGISGATCTGTYAGSVQPMDVPLYWRMRTANDLGKYGAWASGSYSVESGSATILFPIADGLARIANLTEEVEWATGGAHAKAEVTVQYADASGTSATSMRIILRTDAGATVSTIDLPGTYVPGVTYDLALTTPIVRNVFHKVEVIPYVGALAKTSSGQRRFKVQWGQGIYTCAPGATASGHRLEAAALTPAGTDARAAYLHRARGGTTGPWKASVGDVVPQTNWDILVRLSTRGTMPALPSMTAYWNTAAAAPPDQWLSTNCAISLDDSQRRFGVKSLRVALLANTEGSIYPKIDPVLNGLVASGKTQYTFSVYVNTLGLTLTKPVRLVCYDGEGGLISGAGANVEASTLATGTHREGWQRLWTTFTTPEGLARVIPTIIVGGTGQAAIEVRLDAFQMEEGSYASPWTPGLLGPQVILDKGGFQVDATKGGLFRLKGSSGSVRDIIELYQHGLRFGNTDEVRSPTAGGIQLPSLDLPIGATPANPAASTQRIYASGTSVYARDSAGTVIDLGATTGGGGGGPPTGAAGGVLGGSYPNPVFASDMATQAELDAHAAGTSHSGYRLSTADHTHASSGAQAGQIAHSALTGIAATDHHAAPVAGPDANTTVDAAGAAGTASTFARSQHGHQLVSHATAALAVGAASAGTPGTAPSRGNHVHPTGAGTPSTQAFGDAAAVGTGPAAAMTDHKHAMPVNPVTAHEAAGDPHTGYQRESEKGVASGYASLDSGILVPIAQLPTGTSGTTVALGNHAHSGVYEPSGTVATHAAAADPHTGYQKESERDAASGYAALNAQRQVLGTGGQFLAPTGSADVILTATTTGQGSRIELRTDAGPAFIDFSNDLVSDYDMRVILTGDDVLDVQGGALHEAGSRVWTAATHGSTGDPHTQYQRESEKGVASGYASLDSGVLVPTSQLATGTPDGTKYLRDDRTWAVPPGGGGGGAPTGPAGGVLAGTYPNPTFAADMATQAELDAVAVSVLPLYRTTRNDAGGTWWTKIVSGSLGGAYHEQVAEFLVASDALGSFSERRGRVRLRVAMGGTYPAQPTPVVLELLDAAHVSVNDIVLVVTSAVGPVTWEVYLRTDLQWERNDIQPLLQTQGSAGGSTSPVFHSAQTLLASLPAGTQTQCIDEWQPGLPNMLKNGGFRDGAACWDVGGTATASFAMWSAAAADWTLRDGDAAGWVAGSTTLRGSTGYIRFSTAEAGVKDYYIVQKVPVLSREWYAASALLGTQRLTSSALQVLWFGVGGALISTITSADRQTGGNEPGLKSGGPDYDDWEFHSVVGQAPLNAAYAEVRIVANSPVTSGADAYLFIDQVWMGAGRTIGRYQVTPPVLPSLAELQSVGLTDEIGVLTAWTPAWTAATTNPTIGNGTLTGQYMMIGPKLCWFEIKIAPGSTTNFGSGAYSLSLPFQNASHVRGSVDGILRSGSSWPVTLDFAASALNGSLRTDPTTAGAALRTCSATIPVTWSDGDVANVSGIYRTA